MYRAHQDVVVERGILLFTGWGISHTLVYFCEEVGIGDMVKKEEEC
jgi:hypothetical protein